MLVSFNIRDWLARIARQIWQACQIPCQISGKFARFLAGPALGTSDAKTSSFGVSTNTKMSSCKMLLSLVSCCCRSHVGSLACCCCRFSLVVALSPYMVTICSFSSSVWRPPKGRYPPPIIDDEWNESVLSRFIVEMSKTRKVYEILYVGQNHLFETTKI
jgi:hypothetical protein